MAITIDWPTWVVNIPKADMELVQLNPTEIRQLDLNAFRLRLKELEATPEGMTQLKTHVHNPPLLVGGVELARSVELLAPYTVTFEDGRYAVNLSGANSNVGDRVNVNNVSVRSANSAGLVTSSAIEFGEYGDRVTFDPQNRTGVASAGTLYPVGTLRRPSNNIQDAMLIAQSRGFKEVYFISDYTLTTGDDVRNMILKGINSTQTELIIESGADVENCQIVDVKMSGILDGGNTIQDCDVHDLVYFNGQIHHSMINATITLGGGATATIHGCYSGIPGLDTPTIDMGGSGNSLGLRDYSGGITIMNKNGPDPISIDMNSGNIILADSVTAGVIICRGISNLTDYSNGTAVVVTDALVNKDRIATAVWDEPIEDHLITGSTGLSIGRQQFAGKIFFDADNGTSGTTFPIGTEASPVNNILDAITIAEAQRISTIHLVSGLTIASGENVEGYTFNSDDWQELNIEEGALTNNANFIKVTVVDATMSGLWNIFEDCWIYNLVNFAGWVRAGSIENIELATWDGTSEDGEESFFDAIVPLSPDAQSVIKMSSNSKVSFSDFQEAVKITDMVNGTSLNANLAGGTVELDSSCVGGEVTITGIGEVVNNSSITINEDGLMNQGTVSVAVWDEPVGDHLIENTMGHQMYNQAYSGVVFIDSINGTSGTTYPIGTSYFPSNNLTDAKIIAENHELTTLKIDGNLTIDGEDLEGFTILSDRSLGNHVTVVSMVNASSCYFENITINGNLSGSVRLTTCVLGQLSGFDGGAKDCLITDAIEVTGNGANYFTNCDTYITDDTHKEIDLNGKLLNIIRCRGNYEITNKTDAETVSIDLVSGSILVNSSCTSGTLSINGVAEVIDNSSAGCEVIMNALSQDAISESVWTTDISEYLVGTAGNVLDTISNIESGNWEINNNQMIFYDTDGVVLHTFNLFDANGNPSEKSVYKREKV